MDRPQMTAAVRKTKQTVLPVEKPEAGPTHYDMYPAFHLGSGQIYTGIDSLAAYIAGQKKVIIEGYVGVRWHQWKAALQKALPADLRLQIIDTNDWFLPEDQINALLQPYLGTDDSIWGTRCDKVLIDFLDRDKIAGSRLDPSADLHIVMGPGASLLGWDAPLLYFDLPKNELQYRMRAGSITNLGAQYPGNGTQMYKRFYFVDWVVLNAHKKAMADRITIIVDVQRPDAVTWMYFKGTRQALETMSRNVFRARPWFEPGAWGGQWIKDHIDGVNEAEINYAWSFELITPENGLLLESDGRLLEISFDFLMYTQAEAVLGEAHAARFGDQFPIRFDFLDTIEGGNLSIQCHPSPSYIREHFGETFTQDETYYIMDAEKDAGVYLGFQEDIDASAFRQTLEKSQSENTPVAIEAYVQRFAAHKHDFFLIPNGTVHSAAAGNLVLEISATPYIFTFKMYDWLRLDLNGDPRPINIAHAFNNLNFERKGDRVQKELIARPEVLQSGPGWQQIHLPTHRAHFYDVHRYTFTDKVVIQTDGSCQVLMLVEGTSLLVHTQNGMTQRYHYAETFVVPAAAETYTLTNEGDRPATVVKAFLKTKGFA